MQPERINKFIAGHSTYSRRKADELILEGRITLNGNIVMTPGVSVDPSKDTILIDDQPLHGEIKKIYMVLNKPAGYITTLKDEFSRQTVMALVPEGLNLKPAGRLDKDTEGLLILSNDGEFINKITHPKFECEKEYYAAINGLLTEEHRLKLENGVRVEGRRTAPCKIKISKMTKNETLLTITIHEGRKRQIRKMFDISVYPVKYLQRVRIGNLKLGTLRKGQYRLINKKDIC